MNDLHNPFEKFRTNSKAREGPFCLTAIANGFGDAVRAREVIRGLHRVFGADIPLNARLWGFEALESPDAWVGSLQAAAAADLIIVASPSVVPVPEQIKAWLDVCLLRQCASDLLLVALYDGNPSQNHADGPLCTYLEHQAARYQIAFMRSEDFARQIGWKYPTRPMPSPVGILTGGLEASA